MPTLRINNAGQRQFATPGFFDLDGRPAFALGEGEADTLRLDYRGALAGETISTSTWAATGASLSGQTNSAGVVSALVTMPASSQDVEISHTAVTSGGRTLKQTIAVFPEAR